LQMTSNQCRVIAQESYNCPGKIEDCGHCQTTEDCQESGGTTVTVQFYSSERLLKEESDGN
ncbi:MAG: hypothetical protein JSV31_06520, partial [Desulfobacterales bacterium]